MAFREPQLLVNVAVALSTGLTSPWLPVEQPKQYYIPQVLETNKQDSKVQKQAAITAAGQPAQAVNKLQPPPSEALSDIRRALEVRKKLQLKFLILK